MPILDLIARQAALQPAKTAIIDGPHHISYAALLAAADRRARRLVAHGVAPGALVGISMARSWQMAAWVLAILKAGAAYVPLDPAYPPDRLRCVVQEAKLQLAVVDAPVPPTAQLPAAQLPGTQVPGAWAAGLDLEYLWSAPAADGGDTDPGDAGDIGGGDAGAFASRATPDGPAYVIYTSGSTGAPKGVLVGHTALARFIAMVIPALAVRPADVWMLTAAISYAVHVRQLFTPLAVGATLAVAGEGELRDPRLLLAAVKRCGATHLDFVPSYWRTCNRVLRELPAAERRDLLANSLHQIVSVGEPLTYDLVQTWRCEFGHRAEVINILGQTETTGMFALHRLPPDVRHCDGIVPVGAPLEGVELHLLDECGQPVAPGATGEVCVCTPALAAGYLHQPELTARRFLPHPRTPHLRLYRTGDLARQRPDGLLQHLGRSDQQVKVRGKRVDLIEVELHLRRVPGVLDAAVVAAQNADAETELVGYVAEGGGAEGTGAPAPLTLQEIWGHLRLHLPEHALPGRVLRLAELPYLPNGKLDRQGLQHDGGAATPVPRGGAAACRCTPDRLEDAGLRPLPPADDAYPGPPAQLQRQVEAAWQAVLGTPAVCCDDDFFAAGGTSLRAALLAASLGRTLGMRVPVDLIFRAPTPATLALALARLPRAPGPVQAADGDPLVLLRAGDGCPPLFLVHGLGGGVVGYAELVSHLGGTFGVYGLKAAGLDDDAPPDPTIEVMAARYLRAIRTIQPEGPYRLGGYCYGGVVAFEMARQLAAGGEAASLVAIIEGTAPGARRQPGGAHVRQRLALAVGSLPFWWQEYRTIGPAVLRRRVLRKVRAHAPVAPVDDDLTLLPARRQQLLAVHLRAIRSYAPGPYPGRAVLFRGRDRTISQVLRGPLDPCLGWGSLARDVAVTEVPGAHRNIHLEPNAPALAAALAAYLVGPEGAAAPDPRQI